MKNKIIRNKGGWIRIVEAFVAILIITGIVLMFLDRGYIAKEDASKKIFEVQDSILREIQINDTLRNQILDPAIIPPINKSDSNFPNDITNKIEFKIPSYLEWQAKICSIEDNCLLDLGQKDIYSRSVIITTTQTNYNPRQLKLFFWLKEN